MMTTINTAQSTLKNYSRTDSARKTDTEIQGDRANDDRPEENNGVERTTDSDIGSIIKCCLEKVKSVNFPSV